WGTGSDDVWLSSADGQVFHRKPDGADDQRWSASSVWLYSRNTDVGGASTSSSSIFIYANFNGSPSYSTGVSDGVTFTQTAITPPNKSRPAFAWTFAVNAAWASSPNDIWTAGVLGRLNHWDGANVRAAAIALDDVIPVTNILYAIWGSSADDIWVV